ncbi:hypothetical protein [Bradyrhizobium centrolobii]|uniref:hypothetical protein n=1 Tax=Bradyrhizobium centrolobii TaxID=1505087 RepID=UPI000B246DD2|nr:hypothetical protein [Bradyrhizobium centrolobii]
MAETNKLFVEKVLEKIRRDDLRESKTGQRDEKMEELKSEIQRMKAQRSRLGQPPRRRG